MYKTIPYSVATPRLTPQPQKPTLLRWARWKVVSHPHSALEGVATLLLLNLECTWRSAGEAWGNIHAWVQPRDSDGNGLGCAPGSRMLKSCPGDSNSMHS